MEYDWPGNVRELENLIKRMVVLGSDDADPQGDGRRASRWPRTRRRRRSRRCSRAGRRAARRGAVAGAVAPPAPRRRPTPRRRRRQRTRSRTSRGTAAREAERELIFRMLQQTRWNRKETAEILGISYKALLYKIKETDWTRPRDDQ